jgi:hypothetical protein
MKFDAENQHAEAFKCKGFDGYSNLDGDAATKAGELVQKGQEWAQSEQGQQAIQAGKNLLAFKKTISAKRNPDEEVLSKCGKKPLFKGKKRDAWEKCRQETLSPVPAADTTPESNSDNVAPEQRSIIEGGTPSQTKSQLPMDKKAFDWKKNWWVLPLGLGVIYLGYVKLVKK